MTPEFWAIIAVGIGVLTVGATVVGSHWSLHRDMVSLRERMARLEGRVDILITAFVKPEG